MIQVYLSTNTNYDKNGDMALQPLSYEVSAVGINQAVEFTIEHEIDEYGRYEYLQKGNVIKAFTPWDLEKGQLFRIEDIDKDSKEGTIIASGYLLFYDNVKTYVKDFNNENVLICDTGDATGEQAIKKIFKNTNYTGHSNIIKIARSRLERKNIVAALTGDDENSFVNRWGGELFIDNFDIYMNNKIGHDTGLVISYGRNMEYIKESSSYKNTVTRIIPIGFDGLRLTGKTPWVDSPNIDKYPYIMEKEIKFDQVKVKEENGNEGFETIEEARAELIRLSKLLFEEEQIDSPEVSIEVSMYDLQGTLEYESYECYEEVNLGDYIKARHEILNIDTLVRCIGYTWDGLALKYKTIKLGHQIDNYFDKQTDIYNKVNNILNSNGSINAVEVSGILDAVNVTMKACRDIAQPLPVRVMICEDFDKDSPSYGAMCFGSMGFMIAGERTPDDKDWDWRTFGTGKGFFADLIVAGSMLADRIKSGMLMSMNEKTWINMDDGSFNFADALKLVDGKLVFSHTNGSEGITIDKGGFKVTTYSKTNGMEEVAKLIATSFAKNRDQNGLSICTTGYGDYIQIGYEKEDGSIRAAMFFVPVGVPVEAGLPYTDAGIYIKDKTFVENLINFKYGLYLKSNGAKDHVIYNGSNNYLNVFGDNGIHLGFFNGDTPTNRLILHEAPPSGTGDLIESYGNWNFKGYTLHNLTIANYTLANTYANTETRTVAEVSALETNSSDNVRYIYKNITSKNNKIVLNIPNEYKGRKYDIVGITKFSFGDYAITSKEENKFIIETDREITLNIEISIV